MHLFKLIAVMIFVCSSSTWCAMDRLKNQKDFGYLQVSNNSDYTVIIYYQTNYDPNIDMLQDTSMKVPPGHTPEIFIHMASGAKYKIIRKSGTSKSLSIAPALTSGAAICFANRPQKPAMSSTKSARKGAVK